MPRNCGCDNKCSCVIRQGSGASVTGSGRADDPYVISTAGGGGGGGGGFDPGDVKWTARLSAPTGWLVCDGAAVSRTIYSALFASVGVTYGPGDGSSTFNLPDYTGRFVLGADGSHAPGTYGGAETRVLAASQLPPHAHGINHDHLAVSTSGAGDHQHTMNHDHPTSPSSLSSGTSHEHQIFTSSLAGGSTYYVVRGGGGTLYPQDNRPVVPHDVPHTHNVDIPAYYGNTGGAGYHAHTVDVAPFTGTSDVTGSGLPLSIMPPYATALPLIKT